MIIDKDALDGFTLFDALDETARAVLDMNTIAAGTLEQYRDTLAPGETKTRVCSALDAYAAATAGMHAELSAGRDAIAMEAEKTAREFRIDEAATTTRDPLEADDAHCRGAMVTYRDHTSGSPGPWKRYSTGEFA